MTISFIPQCRNLDKEEPPIGSVTDIWVRGDGYEEHYFGLVTASHRNIQGVCWHDGTSRLLICDPAITRWRHVMEGYKPALHLGTIEVNMK